MKSTFNARNYTSWVLYLYACFKSKHQGLHFKRKSTNYWVSHRIFWHVNVEVQTVFTASYYRLSTCVSRESCVPRSLPWLKGYRGPEALGPGWWFGEGYANVRIYVDVSLFGYGRGGKNRIESLYGSTVYSFWFKNLYGVEYFHSRIHRLRQTSF